MENIVFKFKSLIEQFEEQHPELYKQIYDKGYSDGYNAHGDMKTFDPNDTSWLDVEDDTELKPFDNTKVFCVIKQGNIVAKLRCLQFAQDGYTSSQLWKNYIDSHDPDMNYNFFIIFNPTHKEFAIGIDIHTLELMFPRLRNSQLITE